MTRSRFCFAVATLSMIVGSAHAADVQVNVLNVGGGAGFVRAQVCREAEWLKTGCALTGETPARPGVTVVTVHGVPPGIWAVVAFHDRKNDGRVDRSLLGIPTNGVGFSGDPPLGLTGPKFASSSLQVGPEGAQVDVRMHFE